MNTFDLKALLARIGVAEWAIGYREDGREGLRIIHDGQRWSVFYVERGVRWDEQHHVDESKACLDVLARLLTDHVVLEDLAKRAGRSK